MTVALIADWCGPFLSLDKARAVTRTYGIAGALYLALGRRAGQQQTSLQYVGISNDPECGIGRHCNRLAPIVHDFELWIGSVIPNRAVSSSATFPLAAHSLTLDRAQWATAYFLCLSLNIRRRAKPPPESLILLNRWFWLDFETRRNQRGHPDWPDLIEFDREEGRASVVWLVAPEQMIRFSAAEVEALRLPLTTQEASIQPAEA